MDAALDRLTVGLAKSTTMMSKSRQELVAYHEAGHAVMGALTPGHDLVGTLSAFLFFIYIFLFVLRAGGGWWLIAAGTRAPQRPPCKLTASSNPSAPLRSAGKVTIVPRTNGAGGFTLFLPNEDRMESGLYSRRFLEGSIAVALGGTVAEEIVYGENEVTTGASNDLQQVGGQGASRRPSPAPRSEPIRGAARAAACSLPVGLTRPLP